MSLSYTIKKRSVAGNTRRNLVEITVGASGDYSSGIAPAAANCGLTRIDALNPIGTDVGVRWSFNLATGKLQAYLTGASSAAVLTEAAGTDLATKKVWVEAIQYSNG